MTQQTDKHGLNPTIVESILEKSPALAKDKKQVGDILDKAAEAKGLTIEEVGVLTSVQDEEMMAALFATARGIKTKIYGNRIVLFAPMYISSLCKNDCTYCNFRASNKELTRRALSRDEVMNETRHLVDEGHKRVLLVAGEGYPDQRGLDYVLDSIDAIYSAKGEKPGADIRRVNVNLAPLSVRDFRRLRDAKIGTYQLFQETYHRGVYAEHHLRGKKTNFDWRAGAIDRAMTAGIDDVGMGVLLGLCDWRFDALSMLQHIHHLEKTQGMGCHTISVPRMEPAFGSNVAAAPPAPVSDADFKKLVAIMRLAVPYTGIIMSTRENADMRRATLELGVSQISAGSRINPGGYSAGETENQGQFQLGDHRSLDEVVGDLLKMGFTPSFCTACYRLGRTGHAFMDEAKEAEIHHKCGPNAMATLEEYLLDYASPDVRTAGEALIKREIPNLPPRDAKVAARLVRGVKAGKRDLFC